MEEGELRASGARAPRKVDSRATRGCSAIGMGRAPAGMRLHVFTARNGRMSRFRFLPTPADEASMTAAATQEAFPRNEVGGVREPGSNRRTLEAALRTKSPSDETSVPMTAANAPSGSARRYRETERPRADNGPSPRRPRKAERVLAASRRSTRGQSGRNGGRWL